jgi:hypothetical protein
MSSCIEPVMLKTSVGSVLCHLAGDRMPHPEATTSCRFGRIKMLTDIIESFSGVLGRPSSALAALQA